MIQTQSLTEIIEKVLGNTAVKEKFRISGTHSLIGEAVLYRDPFSDSSPIPIAVGDDCAAIPDGNGGYLLFSAEGIITSFLESSPWFAGYSAVMVNISDICSMGGLPVALTDVLWLKDAEDGAQIWAGMKAASEKYGVPIVGGHTCYRSEKKHLAVSIVGKANNLLTSYDARPGDVILMAVDLNGSYFENYPFWNASTEAAPQHLQKCMRLLFEIAERKLSVSAKDISMGGIPGTLAMLLNTSKVGAHINLDTIPKPTGVDYGKWLLSFPSYGYLLTAAPNDVPAIQNIFDAAKIDCAAIGTVIRKKEIAISLGDEMIIVDL